MQKKTTRGPRKRRFLIFKVDRVQSSIQGNIRDKVKYRIEGRVHVTKSTL